MGILDGDDVVSPDTIFKYGKKTITDYERTKEFLGSLDIGYTEEVDTVGQEIHILLQEGNKNISGYANFCTWFDFDLNGKFIQVGAWE